jgi:uncharacterized membrane protein HdeD (DUF308 family)
MVGAGIGLFIMYLPKLISSHIAIIAGMVLVIVGIVQIVKSRKKDLSNVMRNVQLVFGILLLVAGIFFMFNPFHASKIIRILTGVLLLLFAAFNYYVVHVINQRNAGNISGNSSNNASDNIIDTSGVEKPDEINNRIE